MADETNNRNSSQGWDKAKEYLQQVGLVILGVIVGTFFTWVVLYADIRENLAENRGNIDSNEKQIKRLLDAHDISHEPPLEE